MHRRRICNDIRNRTRIKRAILAGMVEEKVLWARSKPIGFSRRVPVAWTGMIPLSWIDTFGGNGGRHAHLTSAVLLDRSDLIFVRRACRPP